MPSNKTWACFVCRKTAKAEWKAPVCPGCRQPMRDCGKRFPVPKSNARAWCKAENELNRIEADNRYLTDPSAQAKARAARIGQR
jgi:hypothetical protein